MYKNVSTQCIDSYGKTRALNFAENLTLFTVPLAPLDVPEVDFSSVNVASLKTVKKFMELYEIKLWKFYVDEAEKIKGVWVVLLNQEKGFIPVLESSEKEALKVLEVTSSESLYEHQEFLWSNDKSSLLSDANYNSKVADYLKEFAIYEWAQNPTTFSIEDNFTVQEANYGPLKTFPLTFSRENSFYLDGKIVVPDIDTAERLIGYVKALSSIILDMEELYKGKISIKNDTFYTSPFDFNSSRVLMGFDYLKEYLKERDNLFTVSFIEKPQEVNPYYYQNVNIMNGKTLIIQNVIKGDLLSAIAVSEKWQRYGKNVGFEYTSYEKENAYKVYTKRGLTYKSTSKSSVPVFGYSNGEYAALLV